MSEEKKITELKDEELEQVTGGHQARVGEAVGNSYEEPEEKGSDALTATGFVQKELGITSR